MSNNNEDGGVYYDSDENMFNNDEDGGIYFNPEDEELIKDHLVPKLKTYLQPKSKDKDCEDLIEMKNVYETEPWLLDHIDHPLFRKNEWFYFVTRTQLSVKSIGRGRNSKRRIFGDKDGGSWKANAKKYIKDEETKDIIGTKQTLKFTYNNKKKQKRGDGTCVGVSGSNSSWIMYEFSLPDENTFQELVLCKIRKINKSEDDNHDESIPVSSPEQQPTNIDHEIVLAPSSLEDQQLLECQQIEDTFAMMETAPRRSPQKDGEVEAMQVTHDVEDDQQQPPINTLSQTTSAPPAPLGDTSLPIEVDDDEDEDEVWNQEFKKHLF